MDNRSLYKNTIKSLETRKANLKLDQQRKRNMKRTENYSISRNVLPDADEKSQVSGVSKNPLKQNIFLKQFDDWKLKKQKLKEIEQKKIRKPAFSSVVPSGKYLETTFEWKPVIKKTEFKPINCTGVRVKENTIKRVDISKINLINKNSPKLKKMLIKAKKENQTMKINDWKMNIESKKKSMKNETIFQKPKTNVVKRYKPAPLRISNTENLFKGIGLLTSTNRKPDGKDRLDILNSSLFDGISPIETVQPVVNFQIEDPVEITNLNPIESTEDIGLNTTYEKIDENDLNTTPLNTSASNKYLSPFVTTARGKGSVKWERVKRESVYKPNADLSDDAETIADHRCKETANYFKSVLEKEILRLNERCNKWESHKQENEINIPEECKDMIDVAIGQTRLLINKKFQQFRGLIVQCESLSGDNRVLSEDLEGFWDMIYKQAENLDERYDKLEKLKNNNWEDPELVPTELKKKNNGAVKKRVLTSRRNNDLLKIIQLGQKEVREKQLLEKERQALQRSSLDLDEVTNGSPMNQSSSKKSILKVRKSVFFQNKSDEKKDEIIEVMENLSMRTPSKPKISFFDANHDTESAEKKDKIVQPKPIIEVMENQTRRSMRTPKPKISFCDANHDTPCSKRKTYAQTPKPKTKFSNALGSPKTPQRASIMTSVGLFTEDEMDSPLPRQSARRSDKRKK